MPAPAHVQNNPNEQKYPGFFRGVFLYKLNTYKFLFLRKGFIFFYNQN